MQIFEYDMPPFSIASCFCGIPPASLCFFDIETTGLSADTSSVYLIGCMHVQKDGWHMVQWFADDYNSEKELLISFFQYLKDYSYLVHYNGSSFDVPYLQKKCRHYCLAQSFPDTLTMIDLYKILRPYRPFMRLDSMRQKNLEEYLGIDREDTFSGKELITLYSQYMQDKICNKGDASKLLTLLLLHNKEDITYMLSICTLLCYPYLFPMKKKNNSFFTIFPKAEKSFTHTKACISDNRLVIKFTLCHPFPIREDFLCTPYSLFLKDNKGMLRVDLIHDTLYYFYKDYKNYYYLPTEDTVIHKSIAAYVDAEYKEKATAATCYSKREGTFAPCFSYEQTAVLHKKYKDKKNYVEINDEWMSSNECVMAYLTDVLEHYGELLNSKTPALSERQQD